MARQKLGVFARLRKKRDAKLAEKKEVAEVAVAPIKEEAAKLVVAREEATAAENKATTTAAKGPKLVSPAKIERLKVEAEDKAKVVERLEEEEASLAVTRTAASPVVASDLEVALTAFDWALILLSVAVEELKISKWYALGGAAVLAVLYYVAEKQGWLDFINF